MMKSKLLSPAMLALALAAASAAQAQVGEAAAGLAPSSAMDTLNGASTGPSPGILDRAKDSIAASTGLGGAPSSNPFGGGGAPAPADPFGAPAPGGLPGDPGGFSQIPGSQAGFDAANPSGQATPIARTKAYYGTRVRCHVTGEIISDARQVNIISALLQQNGYSNDGKTKGDASATDTTWSNVEFSSDMISPEANLVKSQTIKALVNASNIAPADFFNVRVATTEPLSDVPKVLNLEADRDRSLEEWGKRFLRDYRIEPEKMDSAFYPVFVPAPPRAPKVPIPSNFTPLGADGEQAPMGPTEELLTASPQEQRRRRNSATSNSGAESMSGANSDVVTGQGATSTYMNTSALTGR